MTTTAAISLRASEIAEGRYRVPMSLFSEIVVSPFEAQPWDCDQFTVADVLAVSPDETCDVPYMNEVQDMVMGQTSYHVARIAYLVTHIELLDDEDYPLFSVSYAMNGDHALMDGNHRYAAALVRGDEYFIVDIDGDIDDAEDLFEMSADA